MRSGDLALAWEARAPDRTRDLLAVVGFRAEDTGRMRVPGLTIDIVRGTRPDRIRPHPGGAEAGASEDDQAGPEVEQTATREQAGTRLLAVGIATVDLERSGATFPQRGTALPDDELLGARAAVVGGRPIIHLEPTREGRLAATLARHGEGPAALYLEVGRAALAPIRDRLLELGELSRVGNGPFGPQLLASTRRPWGPHLILVARDPAAAGPRSDAWATIER